jgi:hypothetical protein
VLLLAHADQRVGRDELDVTPAGLDDDLLDRPVDEVVLRRRAVDAEVRDPERDRARDDDRDDQKQEDEQERVLRGDGRGTRRLCGI